MSVYHLRDLQSKERLRIKCDDVKVYQAPQLEGLDKEDMFEFAHGYPMVLRALPVNEKEWERLHRDYVSTVIYTLVGNPFSDWVKLRTDECNARRVEQREDNV